MLRDNGSISVIGAVIMTLLCGLAAAEDAYINTTYYDSEAGEVVHTLQNLATYGGDSSTEPEWGWVVHVKTDDGGNLGCTVPTNPHHRRWIALIQRGECKFQEKIDNAIIESNASAVIIYNSQNDGRLQMMHENDNIVAVFMNKQEGDKLAALVDGGTDVWLRITLRSQSREGAHISPDELLPTTAATTTTTTTAATTTTTTTAAATTTTRKPPRRINENNYSNKNRVFLKDKPKVALLAAAVTTDVPPHPDHGVHVTASCLGLFLAVVLCFYFSY